METDMCVQERVLSRTVADVGRLDFDFVERAPSCLRDLLHCRSECGRPSIVYDEVYDEVNLICRNSRHTSLLSRLSEEDGPIMPPSIQ